MTRNHVGSAQARSNQAKMSSILTLHKVNQLGYRGRVKGAKYGFLLQGLYVRVAPYVEIAFASFACCICGTASWFVHYK